jgi:mannose-6-phosphate isomerase-like protein (cupin superfamily)
VGDRSLPGSEAAGATLKRLVGEPGRFAAEHWGRRPLLHRSDGGFEDLLTLGDVDRLLSTTSLRTPLFRLVKDGDTLPVERYTKRGRTGSVTMTGIADPARIFRLFTEGATIVLQSMHRYWPPVALLCRDLETVLGHVTQTNAYITPPGARGLAVHQDSHDVFVLQAFGTKHWEVFEPGGTGPTASAGDQPPEMSVELLPGDCLYLPKGTPHAARAQEAASGHLTVGILSTTWADAIGDAMAEVRKDAAFDEPLPIGYHTDPAALSRAIRDRLEESVRLIDKLDPGVLAAQTIRRFLTTRPRLLPGHLTDLIALERVDDDTVVGRRRGAICVVTANGDRLTVMLGDRELSMPGWVGPAMEVVAEAARFRPADLAPHIADRDSRLVLVRRLIREGLLEVLE